MPISITFNRAALDNPSHRIFMRDLIRSNMRLMSGDTTGSSRMLWNQEWQQTAAVMLPPTDVIAWSAHTRLILASPFDPSQSVVADLCSDERLIVQLGVLWVQEHAPQGELDSNWAWLLDVAERVVVYNLEGTTRVQIKVYMRTGVRVAGMQLATSTEGMGWYLSREINALALAERDGFAIYADPVNPALVFWSAPSNRCNAIVNGQRRSVSRSFAPEDLLPCVGTNNAESGMYFHPVDRRIRKLNNTLSQPLGTQEWLTIGGCPENHAAVGERFIPGRGEVREWVVKGALIPTDHTAIPEGERRRVLAWKNGKITLVTAIWAGNGTTWASNVLKLRGGALLECINGHVEAVLGGSATALIVDDGQTGMTNDGLIYEIVHQGDWYLRNSPGDEYSPYCPVMDNSHRKMIARMLTTEIIQIHDGEWERRVAQRADGSWVIWTNEAAYTTPMTKDKLKQRLHFMFSCRWDSGTYLTSSEVDECLAQTTPEVRFYRVPDHNPFVWLDTWGERVVERAYQDGENTEVEVPPLLVSQIHTCSHCHERVLLPSYRNVRIHMIGEVVQRGTLCGQCMDHGDGHGTTDETISGSGFFHCNDCGEMFHNSFSSSMEDVCETCFEANYSECERCHRTVHTAIIEDGVCETCRRNGARLADYNFAPKLIFHRVDKEPLCFGVEIELEGHPDKFGGSNRAVAEAAARVLDYPGCRNFMIAKRDGSLQNGAEFVSQPFSWEWYQKNRQRFVDIFAQFSERGFIGQPTCGFHIHVSRNAHSNLEEFRALQLVYDNATSWKKLSMRTGTFRYCGFETEAQATRPRERVRVARERSVFRDRYTALNPTNKGTLEWRLWAAASNLQLFESALGMTMGAHAFVRSGAIGLRPKIEKLSAFLRQSEWSSMVEPRLALLSA